MKRVDRTLLSHGSLYVLLPSPPMPPIRTGNSSSATSPTSTSTRSTSPTAPPTAPWPASTSTTRSLKTTRARTSTPRSPRSMLREAHRGHPRRRFGLDETTRGDREMVLGNIRSTLLTLETIRPWEKNPDNYSSTCANAAFVLMERKFAPPDDRLRSLIAREKQMPALLAEARINLKNPPHIYTEIAIEQLPDIISFFEHDVPAGLHRRQRPRSQSRIRPDQRRRHRRAQRAISTGSRPTCCRAPTATSASAPTPSARSSNTTRWSISRSTSCSKSAGPTCAKIRQHFKQVANELEPGKDPQRRARRARPGSSRARSAARRLPRHLQQPHRLHPRPPHRHHPLRRAAHRRRDAALHARHHLRLHGHAGPFRNPRHRSLLQRHAARSKSMTPAEVEGYMHSFNIGTVISTAVHEAYPGHYVQFLWVPQAPQPRPQAPRRQHQRRGLGALLRTDDARRGLRPAGRGRERRARIEVPPPRPAAGRAPAQCPLHRRHRDAHRQNDLSTRLSSSSRRKATSQRKPRSSKPSAAPATPLISTTRSASSKS